MNTASQSRRPVSETLLAAFVALILAAGPATLRGQDTSPAAPGAPASPAANNDSLEQPPVLPVIPAPLPRGKKLVLADGTFQVVREYQREDDRVRYYSLERSAWEEIPSSLVDWQATQKSESEQQALQEELRQKSRAAAAAQLYRELDVDASLQIRTGLFLPDEKGFYVLDGNTVVAMELTKTETHIDKGRAIGKVLSGIAVISDKFNVEIPGKRAVLRLQSPEPEFYFRPVDGREPRISLIRVEVKGDKRAMMATLAHFGGTQTHQRDEIALTVWDAARGVYRFTVEQPLTPGEYAVLEMTVDGVANFVWDFGVDAAVKSPDPSGARSKAP